MEAHQWPDEGQIYDGHGVWVPPGMCAREIIEGAKVLERDFDVAPFISRAMVRAILTAIRQPEIAP